MTLSRFSCYFLALLFPLALWSQDDSTGLLGNEPPRFDEDSVPVSNDSIIRYRLNLDFAQSIYTDLKYTVSRPAHWHSRDFLRLGAVVGAGGALLLADKEIKGVFQRNQTRTLNGIANEIEPFGNIYAPYLLGGMYVLGFVTKNREWEHASLMAGKSLLISTLLYAGTKAAIRRIRPSFSDNNMSFATPFSNDRRFTSFPSGHTLTAMTVATALAETFGEKHRWVPWVAYSIAGLTGISRMYHNRHWVSDVWIGASLGFFVTKTVFRSSRIQSKKRKLALQWHP